MLAVVAVQDLGQVGSSAVHSEMSCDSECAIEPYSKLTWRQSVVQAHQLCP